MEFVVSGVVVQLRLAQLQRADAAQNIGKHLLRGVLPLLAVSVLVGHIICIVGQQEQIAAAHVQALDYLLVKGLPDRTVLQLAGAQLHEEAVLLAVHHLLGGKDNVDQVFAQRPGQRLFQKAQIFFRLLLGHDAQGFVQIGDNLFVGVDQAAVNPADRVFLRPPPAAQLTDFFQIHGVPHFV